MPSRVTAVRPDIDVLSRVYVINQIVDLSRPGQVSYHPKMNPFSCRCTTKVELDIVSAIRYQGLASSHWPPGHREATVRAPQLALG